MVDTFGSSRWFEVWVICTMKHCFLFNPCFLLNVASYCIKAGCQLLFEFRRILTYRRPVIARKWDVFTRWRLTSNIATENPQLIDEFLLETSIDQIFTSTIIALITEGYWQPPDRQSLCLLVVAAGKSIVYGAFLWNIIHKCWSFQQAMFDCQRVQAKGTWCY